MDLEEIKSWRLRNDAYHEESSIDRRVRALIAEVERLTAENMKFREILLDVESIAGLEFAYHEPGCRKALQGLERRTKAGLAESVRP